MMVQSLNEYRKFYMFLPLELTLRPSRVYRLILFLAHGLALAGISLAALPVWVKALMVAILFASTVWLWRETSSGPRGLRVSQSGQIEMFDGEWRPANIQPRPVVLPWFVSLELAPEAGESRRLILWPDSMEVGSFRKLRVWLRWGKLPLP